MTPGQRLMMEIIWKDLVKVVRTEDSNLIVWVEGADEVLDTLVAKIVQEELSV